MRKLIQGFGLGILGYYFGSHMGIAMLGTAIPGAWPVAMIFAVIGLLI
ncbi:hypothetical protein [Marinitoga litoralis]|nr:hypothetical protein [Marinitoga litoralis]MBM7560021.1 hypothetical protein [Marinitoga litoralis]